MTTRRSPRVAALFLLAAFATPAAAQRRSVSPPVGASPVGASQAGASQAGAAGDTLSLRALHTAAMARDARAAVPELLRSAGDLRDRVIAGDRFARPLLAGQLTHQSDVTALPVRLPGSEIPTPPYTRYQVALELDQPLYDAGAVGARRAVERARTTEAEREVATRVYGVTHEVNAAVFTLLLQQAQREELHTARARLERRLDEVRLRVREGAALARDTAQLVAERLRVDELLGAVTARQAAATAQLTALTGRRVGPEVTLPAVLRLDLLPAVTDVTEAAVPRRRPEFARFDATRARLAEEVRATAVNGRPRLSAFVQAGVGRPGLNQLRPDADAFYLAGVRAAWQPFARRDGDRQAQALRAQQRIADLEEQAFAEQLARAVLLDEAEIARLEALALPDTERIAARAEIERVARLELEEGLITMAQWITAHADLADARLAARRHDVERAAAWARLYTTLGLPLQ